VDLICPTSGSFALSFIVAAGKDSAGSLFMGCAYLFVFIWVLLCSVKFNGGAPALVLRGGPLDWNR
jgi:hypothetical protein